MATKTRSSWQVGELLRTIIYALLLAGLLRTLLFQPFWIPSGSMKPTLLIGDFLFVNKFAYGYSRHSCPWSLCPFEGRILGSLPERGDVAVFKHPTSNADFIKRIIGLPGDRIEMRDGRLILNGVLVPQEPAGTFVELKELQGPEGNVPQCSNSPVGLGGVCEKGQAVEELPNGRSYNVLNIGDGGSGDNTEVFVVPEGHVFAMGDNRDNSQDSRVGRRSRGVGFVPVENLVGRADRIIISSSGSVIINFLTWRGDRFFRGVD
ncbi:MAG: signal peptidase I [Pseudomonadota bacterium]